MNRSTAPDQPDGIRSGLTLIETIIGITIITIAFYALIAVFFTIAPRSIAVENIDKKVYLAQEKMEEYLARPFTGITTVAASAFTGTFTNYQYEVVVTKVATSDLINPFSGNTPFKTVKVRVWGGPVDPFSTIEVISLVGTYEVY